MNRHTLKPTSQHVFLVDPYRAALNQNVVVFIEFKYRKRHCGFCLQTLLLFTYGSLVKRGSDHVGMFTGGERWASPLVWSHLFSSSRVNYEDKPVEDG